RIFEGLNPTCVVLFRTVIPIRDDHLLGNVTDEIGMVECNVAPEHQLAIVSLQQITNAIQMFKVNGTDTFHSGSFSTLPFTKLERFVFADMKELAREKLVEFLVPIRN